ncbi:RHS repeat-associated core domain-containing protein [Herbaspirillum sp.]|uniref:RHS repeat-associated core domain-containing protein n=1 Tax=Herbaspirillum sp. TaxID=1890675 RepID=UPI00257D6731|nr:RHS repeat-associated core domain-containing protein [Herbaspirillum sp.]
MEVVRVIVFLALLLSIATPSSAVTAAQCSFSSPNLRHQENNVTYIIGAKTNANGVKVASVSLTPSNSSTFTQTSRYVIQLNGQTVSPFQNEDLTGAQDSQRNDSSVFVGSSLTDRKTWFDISSLNTTQSAIVRIVHAFSDATSVDHSWTLNVQCPDPVNGQCGDANGREYVASATGYGIYQQCAVGTSSDTRFPSEGGYIVWRCSGIDGGSESPECRADRLSASLPDLTIHSISIETATTNLTPSSHNDNDVEVGESFTIYTEVKNIGEGGSERDQVRYYMSASNVTPSRDSSKRIGSDYYIALEPGDISDEESLSYIISEPGMYYLWTCADTVTGEEVFDNNCSSSIPVNVVTPNYSINSFAPVSPQEAVSGSTFTFSCTTSHSLPSGYSVLLNFGTEGEGFLGQTDPGGHEEMGADCYLERTVNSVGTRLVRAGIFDASDNLVGSYSESLRFVVTEAQVSTPPTISVSGLHAIEINVGESFAPSFLAEDPDGDLKTLEVNYGDDPDEVPATATLAGSSQVVSAPHVYQAAGSFSWRAVVKDHAGNVSNSISGSVTVTASTIPDESEDIVTLTIAKEGQGVVISTPAGIDCGNYCSTEFAVGQSVTLSATPIAGWVFSNWSGQNDCQSATTCSISMSENEAATAVFSQLSDPELDADARLINFSPKAIPQGESTTVTVTGVNIPQSFVANIEGTTGYCTQVSYSETVVVLNCNPSEVGDKRFYLKDRPGGSFLAGAESWKITVSPPANTAPAIWVNENFQKYAYVNNSYPITAKSWDGEGNLQKIQVNWQNNSQWNREVTVKNGSGEDVPFSYTPTTTGILNIRFKATDTLGAIAYSDVYQVQVLPQPTAALENTGIVAGEQSREASSEECAGNPISLSNGAKLESRNLLAVNGALPLNFSIHYNSLVRGQSAVGKGWDFENSYAARVIENIDGTVLVYWSDNSVHEYNQLANGQFQPESFGCKLDTLYKTSSGTFVVKRQNRITYFFDEFNFLNRIENENSQGINLTYNSLSQLIRVEDDISGKYIDYSYDDRGRVTQAVSIGGKTVTLAYSENDHLTDITYPDGVVETFSYTDLDQLVTRSVDGELITTTSYDEYGRAIEQYHGEADEEVMRISYMEEDGHVTTSVTDKVGGITVSEFDENHKLTSKTMPDGQTTTYGYDSFGKPSIVTDALSRTTRFFYNQFGDIVSTTLPDFSTEARDYDDERNLIVMTDALGNRTTYTYDENNNLLSRTDPLGNTTTYEYSDESLLQSITTAEGRVTQYSYTHGLVTQITDPAGNIRTLEYNPDGHLIAESDYDGNITRYEVDEVGRRISSEDPMGNTETWEYDSRGNITSYSDKKGNLTTYSYSILDEKLEELSVGSDGQNRIWRYGYDAESRLITGTGPNGNTTTFNRDANGRLVSEVDALGNTTTYIYDAVGQLVSVVDSLGGVHSNTYDSMGRVIDTTTALGFKSENRYDSIGRLTASVDPLGREMTRSYDSASRLVSVEHPGGEVAGQTLNKDDEIIAVTTPVDNVRSMTRDNEGNITQEVTEDSVAIDFGYDGNDRVVSVINGRNQATSNQYDALGRLTQTADDVGIRTYEYDVNGNKTKVIEGDSEITREYDEFNQVVRYSENGDPARQIEYDHDLAGNLTKITYPASNLSDAFDVEYEYDALNRIVAIKIGDDELVTYQYDAKGRVTQLTRANGTQLVMSYDADDRLISSIDKDSNGTVLLEQHYAYDALGRLVQESVSPSSMPTVDNFIDATSMSYGEDNRLTMLDGTALNFDDDGNIQTAENLELSFNVRGSLSQAGDTQYTYNPEGNRVGVTQTVSGETVAIEFLVNPHYMGLPQVIRETSSALQQSQQDYIYGPQGLVAEVSHNASSLTSTPYFYHYDYRGSLLAVSDASGEVVARYAYTPFGKQLKLSGDFNSRFGYNAQDGVLMDGNGLVYMRARYYSPQQRRFVSKDALRGELWDLGSLNRYAFVGGDPVNLVDPSGYYAQLAVPITLTCYFLLTSSGDVSIPMPAGRAVFYAGDKFKSAIGPYINGGKNSKVKGFISGNDGEHVITQKMLKNLGLNTNSFPVISIPKPVHRLVSTTGNTVKSKIQYKLDRLDVDINGLRKGFNNIVDDRFKEYSNINPLYGRAVLKDEYKKQMNNFLDGLGK